MALGVVVAVVQFVAFVVGAMAVVLVRKAFLRCSPSALFLTHATSGFELLC